MPLFTTLPPTFPFLPYYVLALTSLRESKRVNKFGIFFVAQVPKCNAQSLFIIRFIPDGLFLPILPPQVEVDQNHIHNTSPQYHDDRDLGRDVTRSVLGAKSLWPDNVADTVTYEEYCRHCGFLRITEKLGISFEQTKRGIWILFTQLRCLQ